MTGASSGIGAALAAELAARGVEVVLCARRAERLEALAQALREAGGRVRVEPLDVRDLDALPEFFERLDRELGGLDLVVANAGVGGAHHASELLPEHVRPTLEVNVLGAIVTVTSALIQMRRRGHGTLCGVSSLAGLGGTPSSGAYAASKAALSTFLETLTIDLAGSAIEVVDVQPGFVESEMTAHQTRMPFLWPAERAARRIAEDLERGRAISSFPWQVSLPMRFLTRAPRWMWRAVVRRAHRR
ncbi:MAG: SDR family NAD(P)-dependent oxidoreductase [Planctomycetota bacterium]